MTLGGNWIPKLEFLPDWKALLRHAWSVRFIALAAILNGVAAACSLIDPYLLPIPLWTFLAVQFAINAAAFVARFLPQRELP